MASLPAKRNRSVVCNDAIASPHNRDRAYCLMPDRNREHSSGPIGIRQLPATDRSVIRLTSPLPMFGLGPGHLIFG
jgi:hypothetical protein